MLVTTQLGHINAAWIDGNMPNRDKLKRLLAPRLKQTAEGSGNYGRPSWYKNNLINRKDREDAYKYLLGFELAIECSEDKEKLTHTILLYLIPPFRKPDYRALKRDWKDGVYRMDHFNLLQYGPDNVARVCRKVRYRQLVALGLSGNQTETHNKLEEIARNIDLYSFEDSYQYGSHEFYGGPRGAFEMEANCLLKKLASSIESSALHVAVTHLTNLGYCIQSVQAPVETSYSSTYAG